MKLYGQSSMVNKLESDFQSELKKEIESRLPGSIIMKTNPNYIKSIPDLLILYGNKWAALEVKRNKDASHRPGQDGRVRKMNNIGFADFIYPENKDEVINKIINYMEDNK